MAHDLGFFPGSNVPITNPHLPHDPLGGREGKKYEIGGKEVELFTIGQLAFILNRKPGTVRRWELDKVIPKATFVRPGANQDVRGRRRLYSREQVLAVLQAAQEEGILTDLHRQVSKTQFSAKVWTAFRRLAQ